MKKALSISFNILLAAALLDLAILSLGILQIAQEGRTGYWNPFWRTQAEFVVQHLLQ